MQGRWRIYNVYVLGYYRINFLNGMYLYYLLQQTIAPVLLDRIVYAAVLYHPLSTKYKLHCFVVEFVAEIGHTVVHLVF